MGAGVGEFSGGLRLIAITALAALRHKQISIELLVTIALVGAVLIGEPVESAVVSFLFYSVTG